MEDNAGTGGGGGSFVYTTADVLLLAAGGGGGASGGYNGVDGQAGSTGTSSEGKDSSQVRNGGTDGQPGECNGEGASYHGGVGAGWFGQGCTRLAPPMGKEGDHVPKAGSEVKPEILIAVIMGALHQEQLVGLVVGEVVQKIMGHQAEVVDTLGEAVVLISTRPEVEGARTAVVKTVQVCLVGT